VYQRAALILDSEAHELGDLSLLLIALGLQPLYSMDLDELVLLSREYRSQVGAVLLPAAEVAARLPALRKRVLEPLALPVTSVVAVGDPTPAECEALRAAGLRLSLRVPYQAHELRHVVARVLSDTDPSESRRDPRVPCELAVDVELDGRRRRGRLADLSARGAFVALMGPPAPSTLVVLHFTLAERECAVAARVVWRTGPNTASWRDSGMGLELVAAEPELHQFLGRFVAEQVKRFEL
jgi:PilZ domain